eukprot:gene12111-biopygen1882
MARFLLCGRRAFFFVDGALSSLRTARVLPCGRRAFFFADGALTSLRTARVLLYGRRAFFFVDGAHSGVVYMAFCWCGSHKMGKCGVCIPGGTVIVWLEKDRCGVYMCLVAFCDLFGSQGVGMCRLCSTLVVIWLWGSKGSDVCGLCSIMVAVCLLGSTGSEICGVRNFWWAFIPGLKGVEGLPLVRLECSWDLLWDIYNHACFSPGNSFTPPGGISLRPCPCLWSPARVYVFCCTPRHFVLSFVVWVDGVVALDVSSPASFIGSVDRDLVVRIGDSTLISSPRSIAVPPGIGC